MILCEFPSYKESENCTPPPLENKKFSVYVPKNEIV